MKAVLYGVEPNDLVLKKEAGGLAWVLIFPKDAVAIVAYDGMVLTGLEEDILQSLPKMAVFEREICLDYLDAEKLIEWAKASQAVNAMFDTILKDAFPLQTA